MYVFSRKEIFLLVVEHSMQLHLKYSICSVLDKTDPMKNLSEIIKVAYMYVPEPNDFASSVSM